MPNNRIVYGLSYWDFISIKGYPDLPGMKLKTIEKDGVDGAAFLEMHFSADPTPLYCHALVETEVQMNQFVADLKNLQGTNVTLYDAVNYPHDVVITSVRRTSTKRVTKPTWGGVSYSNGYKMTFALIVRNPNGSF